MTLAADAGDDEQITAIDYVPGVRGHAVITVGPDGDGAEALAVWRLGPTGVAVGAWILSLDAARNDPAALHGIMTMLRGRCLVGWSADDSVKSLHRVAGLVAPTMIDRLSDGVVTIPDLLAEIAECRKRYLGTLERYRSTTKSKIVPLTWARDVPLDVQAARLALTPHRAWTASPVAAQAVALAGALHQAIGLWQDTEGLRYRRSYLRSLGQPRALPPRWMARLRSAATAEV
jgi:hypothetical protein